MDSITGTSYPDAGRRQHGSDDYTALFDRNWAKFKAVSIPKSSQSVWTWWRMEKNVYDDLYRRLARRYHCVLAMSAIFSVWAYCDVATFSIG